MKNWEELYNKYNSDEYKQQYEELKEKIDSHKYNQEEMKEFRKMTNIIGNLPKVENLVDYRNKLEKNLEILKKEYNKRIAKEKEEEKRAEYDKNKEKLEKQMQELSSRQEEIMARQKEIKTKLNDKTISDEEKQNLQEESKKLNLEYSQIRGKVDINNSYFVQNEKENAKATSVTDKSALDKYSKEQLREECFKIGSNLSKCNFVAGKLLEGYNLESDFIKEKITKQWKDRKFTSKDPLPLTRKERESKSKAEVEKVDINIYSDSSIKKAMEKKYKLKTLEDEASEVKEEFGFEDFENFDDFKLIDNNNDKSLISIEEFEKEFPRLSKITPKFIQRSRLGKAMIKVKEKINSIKKEDEDKKVTEVDVENEKVLTEREKFMKTLNNYDILEVANKGVDNIQKEKLQKLKEDAIRREKENEGKSQAEKIAETRASVYGDDGR